MVSLLGWMIACAIGGLRKREGKSEIEDFVFCPSLYTERLF